MRLRDGGYNTMMADGGVMSPGERETRSPPPHRDRLCTSSVVKFSSVNSRYRGGKNTLPDRQTPVTPRSTDTQ